MSALSRLDLDAQTLFENTILNTEEVAEMLGYHPHHIYRLVRTGKIPFRKVRGSLKFFRGEILNWVNQGGIFYENKVR